MQCSSCGVDASSELCGLAAARVTWTFGTERGRTVWTCPACSRRHARSMEGRLDSAWW